MQLLIRRRPVELARLVLDVAVERRDRQDSGQAGHGTDRAPEKRCIRENLRPISIVAQWPLIGQEGKWMT